MAFDLANPIGTGTDQELLDFTRAAIAQITLHGAAYTQRGKMLTRASLKDLREQADWLESKVNAAASTAGSRTNYAERHRPL